MWEAYKSCSGFLTMSNEKIYIRKDLLWKRKNFHAKD